MLDCSSSSDALTVKFWGVRGELPSPGAAYHQYGGNTGCVEIEVAQQRLIFDAGTGLCELGQSLLQAGSPHAAHLFLSKTQWGRTQGLSFFGPAFEPGNRFLFYGPVAITGASIRHQLMNQLRLPYSDISLHQLQADLEFQDLNSGQALIIQGSQDIQSVQDIQDSPHADIEIEVIQINPDSRALGYRLSFKGIEVVYATDSERKLNAEMLDDFVDFVAGANLLIYGETGVGWRLQQGDRSFHDSASTSVPVEKASVERAPVEEDLQTLRMLMQRAAVEQVIVTQHPPLVSDRELHEREAAMRTQFDNVCFAREGMQLNLQTSSGDSC